MTQRVWLRHDEHGGYFECPAEAVDEWADLGWVPADAPEEFNPVVAELLAAQQAAAQERAAAEEAAAAEQTRATKSSRKGGAAEPTEEG